MTKKKNQAAKPDSTDTKAENNPAQEPAADGKPPWLLPAVIGGGALAGLLFMLLMPSHWLFLPGEDEHADHEQEAVAGDSFFA
jgi:hypothetical protein